MNLQKAMESFAFLDKKAPIGFWVYAALFLLKIGTKRLGIFSVADHRKVV